MSQYKPYAEYKESGVEWLGHVPAHWNLLKVARDINYTVGWTPSTANAENFGDEFPWVTIADMQSEYITTTSSTLSLKAVRDKNARPIPTGSLLFSFKLSVGKVAFTQFPVFTNEAIAAFTENRRVSLRLLYYAAPIFIPQSGRTNVYNSLLLNQELIGEAKTFLPPLPEQQAIATFLDRETAKIDALIEKKSKFIELLEEKRQALISHAVTKGLNPDAPMKDSGVPWLGEVPAHWEVKKLRYACASIQTGSTPSNEYIDYQQEDSINWFTPGDFSDNLTVSRSIRQIGPISQVVGGIRVFPAGSVLVVCIGATIGKVSLLLENSSANQQINALVPNSTVSGLFLAYETIGKYNVIRTMAAASTLPIINQTRLGDIDLALPPLEEQIRISSHLDQASSLFQQLTSSTHHSIALLREKRSALITAAVTGQIDVRDEVAV